MKMERTFTNRTKAKFILASGLVLAGMLSMINIFHATASQPSEDTSAIQEEYKQIMIPQKMAAYANEYEEVIALAEAATQEVVELQQDIELSKGFVISCYEDIFSVQINKSYDIPAEFYYDILPATMHPIIDSVCELEHTQEISSMFLIAVAATEVGWEPCFASPNNWYNWTPDAQRYQCFSSAADCVYYTGEMFQKQFFNPEWYEIFGQYDMDDCFTITEVNIRYALWDDCTVNTYWSEVVGEIMYMLNNKYSKWKDSV